MVIQLELEVKSPGSCNLYRSDVRQIVCGQTQSASGAYGNVNGSNDQNRQREDVLTSLGAKSHFHSMFTHMLAHTVKGGLCSLSAERANSSTH